MMRNQWYAVTVRKAGQLVTFPEYASDETAAVECYRSRGRKARKAAVISVAPESEPGPQDPG